MFSKMLNHRKINTNIVTGFLGAGKTTFINQLLRKYSNRQFALVENEFGEVSIDTRLIKGVNATHLFEMKNGCICCTITNEYEMVLQELAGRFPHINELLIETTGIANPASAIKPIITNPNLTKLYHLRGIVCIADAINLHTHLSFPESMRQLISADTVVVSKTDRVSITRLPALSDQIRNINPFADHIFNTASNTEFELKSLRYNKRDFFVPVKSGFPAHKAFSSRTVYFDNPIDRKKFEHWLSYLLNVFNNQIYRVKGLIYFSGEPFEYIVYGVGHIWEITEGDFAMEKQTGVLVFIGELENVPLHIDP